MRIPWRTCATIAGAMLFVPAAFVFSLWLQRRVVVAGIDALPGNFSSVLLMGLVTLAAALGGRRRRFGRPSLWWVQAAQAFAGAAVFVFLALSFLALSRWMEGQMTWPLDWMPWQPWLSLRDLVPIGDLAHFASLAGRLGGFLLAYAAAVSLALGAWPRGRRFWAKRGRVERSQTRVVLLGALAVGLCYPWVWLRFLGPDILGRLGLSDWVGLPPEALRLDALAAAGLDLFAQAALLLWLFQYLWTCPESVSPGGRRAAGCITVLLAATVLGGSGSLGIRQQPYWTARFHGTGAHLSGADLSGAALGGARLAGADLAGANLRRALLNCADLSGANLRHAHLNCASLNVAKLRHADLTGASLRGAVVGWEWEQGGGDLTAATLTEAELAGAQLRDANLAHARLERADLTGADLGGSTLNQANLTGARLTRSTLRRADLSQAILAGADLAGAVYGEETRWPAGFDPRRHGALRLEPGVNLAHADLHEVYLWDANLARANLAGADLVGANLGAVCLFDGNLTQANLANADLGGADLSGAVLDGADLRGANLRLAHLRGASLTGARCDARTRWPAGFDPARHGARLVK